VQVRKAIANGRGEFLDKARWQKWLWIAISSNWRIALESGIGELRGNGQFTAGNTLGSVVKRNEETIADDLDLTFALTSRPVGH